MSQKLLVRSKKKSIKDSTSFSLMVESHSSEEISEYDHNKIADALARELQLDYETAMDIATITSDRIKKAMENSSLKTIDTSLIRSFVNVILYEKGITKKFLSSSDIIISAYDVKQIIESANKENGNMEHNPESINFTLAERIIKEYAMKHILEPEVAAAHLNGEIHIHDAGSFTKAYCSGHTIEYIKIHGIKNIPNIPSRSVPAKHAETLARHLCSITQFYSSIFAGAIGWEALNIFFAPFLVDASYDRMKKIAKTIVFDLSQLSGAKGGQVSFTDFNLYVTIPEHYRRTYAIFPRGLYYGFEVREDGTKYEFKSRSLKEMEKWEAEPGKERYVYKYGDLEVTSQLFLKAILDVALEGDGANLPFSFPKFNLHINEDAYTRYKIHGFTDNTAGGVKKVAIYQGIKTTEDEYPKNIVPVYTTRDIIPELEEQGFVFQREPNDNAIELIKQACEVTSKNGGIYFLFDRSKFSMAQCCRLKIRMDEKDMSIIKEPSKLRFVGLQNVSINLPNASLKAKDAKTRDEKIAIVVAELEKRVEWASKAHVTRRNYLKYLSSLENSPLKFYSKGMNGEPYVDFDTASYLIGVVGLNECVYNIIGEELHDSEDAYILGISLIVHLHDICKKIGKVYGLELKLEETPAESTATRFASIDVQKYGDDAFVKRNEHGIYYTNSIHFAYDSDVSFPERIQKQSRFHPLFEAGSIIHGWVGDRLPDPEALYKLVESTYRNTECEQFTISPDLTMCKNCNSTVVGFREKCPLCESDQIEWFTRVTGYLIPVKKFNRGKIAELHDRNRKANIL